MTTPFQDYKEEFLKPLDIIPGIPLHGFRIAFTLNGEDFSQGNKRKE